MAAADPLLADGELPELLLLEALAQTAACLNAGALGGPRGLLVAAQRVAEFDGRARAGERIDARGAQTADGERRGRWCAFEPRRASASG